MSRLLLGLALLAPLAARAEPLTLLVCYPGGPVRPAQARPAIEQMAGVLAELAALDAVPKARFEATVTGCEAALAERPGLAILTLAGYLDHRADFTPLARPQVQGALTDTLHLVVKRGGPKGLAALKGKRLGGTPLAEPALLDRLAFAGALKLSEVEAQPTPRPLRALRQLHEGGLDGVLLTRVQHASLASLPFAGELETVWTSAPLPVVGLLAHTRRTDAATQGRLRAAALKLCPHPEGKALCALFGLEGFEPADATTYAEAAKAWGP